MHYYYLITVDFGEGGADLHRFEVDEPEDAGRLVALLLSAAVNPGLRVTVTRYQGQSQRPTARPPF